MVPGTKEFPGKVTYKASGVFRPLRNALAALRLAACASISRELTFGYVKRSFRRSSGDISVIFEEAAVDFIGAFNIGRSY